MNRSRLFAVFFLPIAPAVEADEVSRAVDWLRAAQGPDGAWAAPCGDVTEATAVAARALAEAGGPGAADAVARALAFLESRPGPLLNHHRALRALALEAAGRDARADLERLAAGVRTGYDPPGGWGLTAAGASETVATALALEALSRRPELAALADLDHATWTLIRATSRFPVLFTADPASRDESGSLYASAHGIVACHLFRVSHYTVQYRTWAIDAARQLQDASGGYGEVPGSPSALETAALLHAIKFSRVRLGEHEMRATAFLLERQAVDGSWDQDALVTAWVLRALAIPYDTDGDGMADAWEGANGLDFNDPADATGDVDDDGLVAAVEHERRTDPQRADTDGDGLSDRTELESGSDPRDAASRNAPPRFVSTPVTFAALGGVYRHAARAVDADGDPVTYALAYGPLGMAVGAASGEVSWSPTAAAAGKHPVALEARDGRGGRSTQSYVLEARAQGVDLAAARVDLRGLAVDSQSLTALGTVSVGVENRGTATAQTAFEITLFVDRNGTRAYEAAADPVVGRAGFSGAIAAGAATTIVIPASAAEAFRDAPLLAFVDSGQAVGELDETNNVLSSAAASQFAGDMAKMRPVIEWWWQETDPPDFNSRVALPPVVANLTDDNGDGTIDEEDVPEVLFVASGWQGFDGYLRAARGDSGELLWSWPSDGSPIAQPGALKMIAVGDLDGDGTPEVVLTASLPGMSMVCINADGTEKWRRGSLPTYFNWGSFVLADLHGDGTLEILSGSNVFDHEGNHLWEAPYPIYGGPNTSLLSLPLAVDLDLDGTQEVVLGMSAHDAGGRQLWDWQSETLGGAAYISTLRREGQVVRTLEVTAPDMMWDAHTAAIQADDDPEPEILCVGWYFTEFGPRHVPVWILEPDGEIKLGPIQVRLAEPERHRSLGSASPLVADLDRDGRQDFVVVIESAGSQLVSPKQVGITTLFAFDRDGHGLWSSTFNSGGADHLPSVPVACDLDGDGQLELVLQTAHQLHILDGRTGQSLWSLHADAFFKITSLPAVADVDNDGNVEIVGIATDQYTFGTSLNRGVFVIGDTADQWGNARRSWNHHRYNAGGIGEERHQLPLEGHRATDAPDLTASRLRNDPAACPEVVLLARIGNAGSLHVPVGVPVEFWQGDPGAGGTLIGVSRTTRALQPGDQEDVRLAWPGAPAGGAAVHAWVSPQRPWRTVHSNDLIGEINARAPLAFANGSSQNTHGWGIFTYFGIDGSGWSDSGSFDLEWLPYRFYEVGFAIPVTLESVTLTNPGFASAGWRSADLLVWRQGDLVPGWQTPVMLDAAEVTTGVPGVQDVRRFRFQGNDVLNYASFQRLEAAGSFEDPYPDWDAGIYPRLSEGRDDNNYASAFVAWTCAGNAAPAIVSAPPLLGRPGELYRYEIAAEDPNGDPVSFELLDAPGGMASLGPGGPLEWTPLPGQVGQHDVRVRASDPDGAAAEQSWTVSVVAIIAGENRPPRITSGAPAQATGVTWSHAFMAEDPDGDGLVWLLLSGAPGMTLDPENGVLSWPPREGAFPVAVRVEDGRGGADEQRFTLSPGESDAPLPVAPVDRDGDGHFTPQDCDDARPQVNPGMNEVLGNGIDDDCNAGTPDAIAPAALSLLLRPSRARYDRGAEAQLLARVSLVGPGGALAGLRLELRIVDAASVTVHTDAATPGTLVAGGRLEQTFRARTGSWPLGRLTAHLDATAGGATTSTAASFVLGTPAGDFRRGDANADGRVDISDAVTTLGFLFLGTYELSCQDAADADDSGTLNITDPIYTLGHLFLGGPPLPAPGVAGCGEDPSADDLPPCDYPGGRC